MIVNSRILVFVFVKRTRASSHVSCAIEVIKLLLLLLIAVDISPYLSEIWHLHAHLGVVLLTLIILEVLSSSANSDYV